MTPAQLHAKLVTDSPIMPNGQPYGVVAFGGDVMDNRLCRETTFLLNQYMPTGPVSKIIEVGSGGGRWTRHIERYANAIMAVDASPKMPDHIKALHLKPVIVPYVTKHWSLPTHPGSPIHGTFDLAFSYDTYVHCNAREILASIRGLSDALKPGGVLIAHYATLERKGPQQPHDESGMWITHWPYWFNTLLHTVGLTKQEEIYADEGFGSCVVVATKDAN